MSTQVITGLALTTGGASAPLQATLTDGLDNTELLTNTDFTITAQSLGTFLEGSTITHLSVTASTGLAYAGLLRNGQYIAVCQSLGSNAQGGQNQVMPILPGPVRLVAGDQIIVRCEA